MLVLGIETSCDEVAASVIEDGHKILSNIVKSTASIHEEYGGVFPELASRGAIELIIPVIDEALKVAKVKKDSIDLIAVTKGPGLIGSLLIGLNTAKSLSMALNIPFIGVNHVEAHLYAALMAKNVPQEFPALGVVLSGGHTFLVKILDLGKYEMIGQTVDDAIGEAFDKVAKMLDLPYPGGPEIEKLAKMGDDTKYSFVAGRVKKDPLAFSFSGLKTSVLYAIKGQGADKNSSTVIIEEEKKDIAASFQKTALLDVVNKSMKAFLQNDLKAIYLGGGVCLNEALRSYFSIYAKSVPLYFAPKSLCSDNAAMIAGLGYHIYQKRPYCDPLDLEALTRIPISNNS